MLVNATSLTSHHRSQAEWLGTTFCYTWLDKLTKLACAPLKKQYTYPIVGYVIYRQYEKQPLNPVSQSSGLA